MARTSTTWRLQAALQIHQLIASGNCPNATTLSHELGVSLKTVRGYLRLLADLYQVRPVYDPHRHGFYYAEPAKPKLIPMLSEDEIVTVFLLDAASRSLSGLAVDDAVKSALRKLSLMIPAHYAISLDDIGTALSVRRERAEALPAADPAVLQILFKAIMNRQRVACVYTAMKPKKSTVRKLDPLHLMRCEGQWYCVSYCNLRRALRTFVPARMANVQALPEYFERPADFDAQSHFKSAFGIVAGMNVSEVTLRFTPPSAGLIRERRWHATQSIEPLPDESVRLRMTCSHGEELIAWLLSWGEQVGIEAPAELANEVRERHRRAMLKTMKH